MPVSFLEVDKVQTHFRIESGFVFKRRIGTSKAVDGIRFYCGKAKCSAWWANPAAENQRSIAPSCNRFQRPRGTLFSKAET